MPGPAPILNEPHQPVDRPLGGWQRIILVVACLIAGLLAVYLTSLKLTGHITDLAGCGGPEGCASLLGGRWGNWLRVPVSLWALAVYVPLGVLAVWRLTTPRQTQVAFAAAAVLFFAAVWFLFVQWVIERQFCPYCLALHACGLAAFLVLLVHVSRQSLQLRASTLLIGGLIASVAMIILVSGQLFGPQPATFEITTNDYLEVIPLDTPAVDENAAAPNTEPTNNSANRPTVPPPMAAGQATGLNPQADSASMAEATHPPSIQSTRVVQFFDGAINLDIDQVPLLGHPDARHVMLKYFDYTCRSCRQMHDELAQAIEAYPNDLAVIVMPCPLSGDCNPYVDAKTSKAHSGACDYSRLALAVWRANSIKFLKLHDELFSVQGRLTPLAAQLIAESLVGESELAAAMEDPWVDAKLKQSIEIYGRLRRRNPRMPKLLLGGNRVLHGAVEASAFQQVLQQQFQLGPSSNAGR